MATHLDEEHCLCTASHWGDLTQMFSQDPPVLWQWTVSVSFAGMGHTTAPSVGGGGGPAVCTHTEVKAGLWWLGSTCSRLSSIFGWLIVSEEVVVRAWKQEFVGGNSSCWWGKMMAQSRSFRRDEGCGRSSLLDTHTSSLRLASF